MKKKKEVYKIPPLTEGKKNIIAGLLSEYDIKTAEDIQEALKDLLSPIFKFSPEVRKVIYTTNSIESLNSTYKKLNSQRSIFPSDKALLKALYLATLQATKKWGMPLRNWGKIYGEFSIMYEERFAD